MLADETYTADISIHSLRMEGDLSGFHRFQCFAISIHSLRMEGDALSSVYRSSCRNFNPLPPHGGRPAPSASSRMISNFNPLPPHGGRHGKGMYLYIFYCISIHSLRMEGDLQKLFSVFFVHIISIHSLRMEGDSPLSAFCIQFLYFNPLPPHGGRQYLLPVCQLPCADFNPLPPHGGRPTDKVRAIA